MAKKALPMRIDVDLLRRVDEARGDVSRTRWVERALESALAPDTRESGGLPVAPAPTRAPDPLVRAREQIAKLEDVKFNEPGRKTARELAEERAARFRAATRKGKS